VGSQGCHPLKNVINLRTFLILIFIFKKPAELCIQVMVTCMVYSEVLGICRTLPAGCSQLSRSLQLKPEFRDLKLEENTSTSPQTEIWLYTPLSSLLKLSLKVTTNHDFKK